MVNPKPRKWDNWATVEEISFLWKVSKRRVQQIIAANDVNKAILVTQDPIKAVPIYQLPGHMPRGITG